MKECVFFDADHVVRLTVSGQDWAAVRAGGIKLSEDNKILLKYPAGVASVEIPAGITVTGNSAFCGCCILPRVVIPDSVSSIGVMLRLPGAEQ